VELQSIWPELERAGVALFALSYDAVPVLAGFAEKRGITFPLLSDEGSHAIRALGLLNEHVVAQHAFYGVAVRDEHHGVPYPGTFVLDDNGVIVGKYFEQSYRVRPTAALFYELALGRAWEPLARVEERQPGVHVRAWTDAPTYRPYQQLRLHVQLQLEPGTHVFASPVPAGYTPLRIEVEPLDGLTVGECALPAPRRFNIDGVDEELLVYADDVRFSVPLLLTKNLGATQLDVQVAYQSCGDTVCFAPTSKTVTLHLEGLDLIRD
jgi:peroxiredoxin